MPTRDAIVATVLAGLLLFVAFNLQAGWVYAMVAVLAGVLIVGAVTSQLSVRGIRIDRAIPAEAFEGERVAVTLTLHPARWPRLFLELTDRVLGLEPASIFVPAVPPGRSHRVTYYTTAQRRGEHLAGAVTIRSVGLTGLFRASRSAHAPGTITVFPRYWPLRRAPVPGGGRSQSGDVHRRSRSGTEFVGVREYRGGDSIRRVHWRSTARWGQLVVREFEDEAAGNITVLVDTRAGSADPEAFEQLVRAAASVAHFVTQSGGRVRIIAGQQNGVTDISGGWRDAVLVLARMQCDGSLTPAGSADVAGLAADIPITIFTGDADNVVPLVRRGHPLAVVASGAAVDAELMLAVLGIPACILRPGEEVAACLESSPA